MASWNCECGAVTVTIKSGDAIVHGTDWYVFGADKTHIKCKRCEGMVRVGYRIVSTDHLDSSTYKQSKHL